MIAENEAHLVSENAWSFSRCLLAMAEDYQSQSDIYCRAFIKYEEVFVVGEAGAG